MNMMLFEGVVIHKSMRKVPKWGRWIRSVASSIARIARLPRDHLRVASLCAQAQVEWRRHGSHCSCATHLRLSASNTVILGPVKKFHLPRLDLLAVKELDFWAGLAPYIESYHSWYRLVLMFLLRIDRRAS